MQKGKKLKQRVALLIMLGLGLACSSSAFGATIVVPDQYPTIQQAIDAAGTGDQVVVHDGTYLLTTALDFKGKAITVRSQNGPRNCSLNGQQQTRVVYFHSNEGNDSILSGFTVQNGRTDKGGGIYCSASSPTITNCIITGNGATSSGGGLCCESSSPIINECSFTDNYVDLDGSPTYGGGIYVDSSSPSISKCIIRGNSARSGRECYGGGIYSHGSSLTLVDSLVMGNKTEGKEHWASRSYGGGLYCESSSPNIISCIFNNNSSLAEYDSVGGAIYCFSSVPSMVNTIINGNAAKLGAAIYFKDASAFTSLTNCTIVRNTASNDGGGLYCENSSPVIVNSILYQNSPNEVVEDAASNSTITYSLVTGGYTGTGNKNENPRFVDIAGQDFHLASDSPCIDSGDSTTPELPSKDKDGHPRITQAAVDMGAFEYQGTGSLTIALLPSAIEAAGAQWRVDGSAWNNSGDTVTDLAVGQHTLEFSTVSGWNTPASRSVTIGLNETADITVTYAQIVVKPVVTIKAADVNASEPGKNKAKLVVARTGPTTAPLKVYYKVSGTAKNSIDYRKLAGTITIPTGKASASLAVTVLDDKIKESSETIKVRVTANAAYTVGSPASTVVTIADND